MVNEPKKLAVSITFRSGLNGRSEAGEHDLVDGTEETRSCVERVENEVDDVRRRFGLLIFKEEKEPDTENSNDKDAAEGQNGFVDFGAWIGRSVSPRPPLPQG